MIQSKKENKAIEKWKHVHEQVKSHIQQMTNEIFIYKPHPDIWSVSQVINHIILSESQILASMQWRIQNHKINMPVGLLAKLKMYILDFRFRISISMKAPDYVANPENRTLKDTLAHWENVQTAWYNYLPTIDENIYQKSLFKHPILGYLNLYLTIRFMTIHLQRHFKKIQTIYE